MKIIFFGNPNIAIPILDKLRQQHDILAAVTSPDAPVGRKQILTPTPLAQRNAELGIPVLKPDTVKDNLSLLKTLKVFGADIFIVVAYGKILPASLLYLPPLKTLNIHFSLLPAYRGPAPIQAALLHGDKITGTTIFQLDEQMDHGPILAQKKEPVANDDTFTSLSTRLAISSGELLLEILPAYAAGAVTLQVQDESLVSRAPLIKKTDGLVDWQQDAKQIYNRYRAFERWPGIYTFWQGKMIKIKRCKNVTAHEFTKSVTAAPGTVLKSGLVACGHHTILKIMEVQMEGKKPTPMTDFINGYLNPSGTFTFH